MRRVCSIGLGCLPLIVLAVGLFVLATWLGFVSGRRTSFNWAVVVGSTLTLVVGGGIAIRAMRREQRRLNEYEARLQGRCEGCGYDLRGTPDRCPECGRVVDADTPG